MVGKQGGKIEGLLKESEQENEWRRMEERRKLN